MELLNVAMLHACGVRKTDAVLVGLSGGADSVALLVSLCDMRSAGQIRAVHAAHLHHGMRKLTADADMAFCEALCGQLGVPLIAERADVPRYAAQNRIGEELAARRLRYAFLAKAKAAAGADCIAVAHHMDDQAETVLMHLLRGSGLNGLCGMRPRNGDIVRPLLTLDRARIEAYLTERAQPWRTDETNLGGENERSRMRTALMPLLRTFNPAVTEALCRTAGYAQADEAYLADMAEAAWREVGSGDAANRARTAALPGAIRMRVLMRLMRLCDLDALTHADVTRLDGLLTAQTGTCIQLRDGRSAWVDAERLHVGVYPACMAYETAFCGLGETVLPNGGVLTAELADAFQMPRDGNEAYMDMAALPDGLSVRTRRNGDRFHPLGAPGMRKLSDYLTDRKVPLAQRDMPLLCAGDEVLYVIGFTVSERVRVKPDTQQILHIMYRGNSQSCAQKTCGATSTISC